MYRITVNSVKKFISGSKISEKALERHLATVKEVFPNKTDFPARHIGPRKTDVVSMLDLLGFKVVAEC